MWFFLWTFLWITVHEDWQILKTWWTHESIIWTSTHLCPEAKGRIYLTYTQHRSDAAPCRTAKILLTPHAQANLLPIGLTLKAPYWQVNRYLTSTYWHLWGVTSQSCSPLHPPDAAGHSTVFPNHASEIFGSTVQGLYLAPQPTYTFLNLKTWPCQTQLFNSFLVFTILSRPLYQKWTAHPQKFGYVGGMWWLLTAGWRQEYQSTHEKFGEGAGQSQEVWKRKVLIPPDFTAKCVCSFQCNILYSTWMENYHHL